MLGAVKRCAEEECCAGEEHYAVASYLSGDVLDRLSRCETSSAAAATVGYVSPRLSLGEFDSAARRDGGVEVSAPDGWTTTPWREWALSRLGSDAALGRLAEVGSVVYLHWRWP